MMLPTGAYLDGLSRPAYNMSETLGRRRHGALEPMSDLPETVLQFGSGKFLRGFADLFIHQMNADGQRIGRIVVVQSTGDGRANALTEQSGRYHVAVRGLAEGQIVDRVEESASISRALFAARQWHDVLAVARAPSLRFIISNTAETGYNLDAADHRDLAPPASFPAKLLLVLHERFRAGQPGIHLLPCELFEHNADTLQGIVVQLAAIWKLPTAFTDWLHSACIWHNTLVDRIVTVQQSDDPRLSGDALAVVGEPYSLWAIEAQEGAEALFRHPAVRLTPDHLPFFLRKVRILNAAHTALVTKAKPKGIALVREAMADAGLVAWLRQLLFDEIVPTLAGRVEAPAVFAEQTLERFRNPFLDHKISDILAYHAAKVQIRLVPTRDEFREKFGRTPPLLQETIGASTSIG
jgi:tagaturonate reductase